jgi:cation transport regulator
MPYARDEDLPEALHVLPKDGRDLWRRTFNAVYNRTRDEDRARRIAWTAVKRRYRRLPSGRWVARADAVALTPTVPTATTVAADRAFVSAVAERFLALYLSPSPPPSAMGRVMEEESNDGETAEREGKR